jgi:gliding motility-associated-like protein
LSNTCTVDSIIIANGDIFQIPSNTTSVLNYLGNDDLINNQTPISTVIQLGSSHGATVTMSANHVLSYTPATDFIGFDTLIYQICDSVHAPVANPYLCDTALIIVAVGPNVINDNFLVKCNDSLFFNPLTNDNYGNGNYPYTTSILLAPTHGTFSLNNNLAQYIANTGFTGIDTIVYEVCVKGLCNAGIIFINVSCQLPPIAVDDYISVKNNQSNTITMLSNDTTNGNLVNVQVITGPTNGTYTLNSVTHTITYIPNERFVGNDKIQYVICNPVACDTAWIYLAVVDNYPCQLSTGFSPNGDGINDFYKVECAEKYTDSKLTIFNRWGNIVYDRKGNTSNSNSWDGKYNGVDLPDGTYYYIFIVAESDKNPKTGFIELIR